MKQEKIAPKRLKLRHFQDTYDKSDRSKNDRYTRMQDLLRRDFAGR